MTASACAHRIRVRGVVQGVGFRPHVYRLARTHRLAGWILNREDGVEIHVEGAPPALEAFERSLAEQAPPAATIVSLDVAAARFEACAAFEILESRSSSRPTTRISPDLPVCAPCLRELSDGSDRRAGYPYINCTDCGPRYSIVRALPYDRLRTTMAGWSLCGDCRREYEDPLDRRFHAQPLACPACGPRYALHRFDGGGGSLGAAFAGDPLREAARLLSSGAIVAVKGIGGYHLACDAGNAAAVAALRERKYRKEQAFALMVRDAAGAHDTCHLTAPAAELLQSPARPIVLAPGRIELAGVAPDNHDLGVMLPYTPVHHLLFAAGAPPRLVMTSGNRSSEPIAYRDDEAAARLAGLADAILVGERPIARRVDDSVVRDGALGPVVLRRSRGLAPQAVAALPIGRPVLALGGDLKNSMTLVVDGQAYVSQHVGDLEHFDALTAFRETIQDLVAMYEVSWDELLVVHDQHPQYASTLGAGELPVRERRAVQHHRAHVASVLAERGEMDRRVIGLALDGTGYGDDATIWGGEIFAGSISGGFARIAHLRPALLPGGDAAARHPVQAAAGFLAALDSLPDLTRPPFSFPDRYQQAAALASRGVRTFTTSSAGRLFDTVAALVGFTRPITFEGQAAMWLEQLARQSRTALAYPLEFDGREIDWRSALARVVEARLDGAEPSDIARAFHHGLARGLAEAADRLLEQHDIDLVVVSGGVAQNDLLLSELAARLARGRQALWSNQRVPPNDGGISLGQAALATSPEEP